MKRAITPGLLALLMTAACSMAASPAFFQASCDRECLRGFITQYLNAMVAHNPKSLPLAADVRFTEDTKTLPLGEGLWKGASVLRTYRQDFLDVREGMAAAHVIVEEGGNPVMLALRLKISDKKMSEIETMVTRNRTEGALFSIDALTKTQPGMNVFPDASQKMSRADMIRISEFYPLGLKAGGSFEAVHAPFAPDAYRIENGSRMAGPGARAGSEKSAGSRPIRTAMACSVCARCSRVSSAWVRADSSCACACCTSAMAAAPPL